VAKYRDSLILSGTRDEVLATFRDAADELQWSPRSDRAQGGLDIDVPANWRLLRPRATIEIRPAPMAGGQWRANLCTRIRMLRPAARAQAEELLSALKAVIQGGGAKPLIAGRWSWEQAVIRPLVIALAAAAVIVAVSIAPAKKLPAVALDQPVLYRMEVAVAVFYAGLVIVTPLFFGAARGRLPTEVSARGAKFAEEVDESIKETQELADDLETRVETAERLLALDRIDIQKLANKTGTNLRA
jgi:hypothetical protein